WTEFGVWLRYFLALRLQGQRTLDRFSGLDAGLDQQVTHQARTDCLRLVVGQVMEAHPILFLLLPAGSTNQIEGTSKLLKGLQQGGFLFWGGMQLDAQRSIHTKMIPYMSNFCTKKVA